MVLLWQRRTLIAEHGYNSADASKGVSSRVSRLLGSPRRLAGVVPRVQGEASLLKDRNRCATSPGA